MQLLTERLFLIPLRPDGMRALLARTTDPELIQPYTDMLNLSLAHPRAVGLVHRMGALPERFRRLGRRPLLQGPARKRPAGNWLRPSAGI